MIVPGRHKSLAFVSVPLSGIWETFFSGRTAGVLMSYHYYVVPFIGRLEQGKEDASRVSAQLQTVIDYYSRDGWEFYSVEKIGIEIHPGCLGVFLGQRNSYINFDQVIFRKPSIG
jgi:hypothetical protein